MKPSEAVIILDDEDEDEDLPFTPLPIIHAPSFSTRAIQQSREIIACDSDSSSEASEDPEVGSKGATPTLLSPSTDTKESSPILDGLVGTLQSISPNGTTPHDRSTLASTHDEIPESAIQESNTASSASLASPFSYQDALRRLEEVNRDFLSLRPQSQLHPKKRPRVTPPTRPTRARPVIPQVIDVEDDLSLLPDIDLLMDQALGADRRPSSKGNGPLISELQRVGPASTIAINEEDVQAPLPSMPTSSASRPSRQVDIPPIVSPSPAPTISREIRALTLTTSNPPEGDICAIAHPDLIEGLRHKINLRARNTHRAPPTLEESLRSIGCPMEVASTVGLIPSGTYPCLRWARYSTAHYDLERETYIPIPPSAPPSDLIPQPFVLLHLTMTEISAFVWDPESFARWRSSINASFSSHSIQPILLLEGRQKYEAHRSRLEHASYTAQVQRSLQEPVASPSRTQALAQSQPQPQPQTTPQSPTFNPANFITSSEIDDIILDLEFADIMVQSTKDTTDSISHILEITKEVASRDAHHTDGEGEATYYGKGAADIGLDAWITMLTTIRRVTYPVARAIVALYPSPSRLYAAWDACPDPEAAALLLADVPFSATAGSTITRRFGPLLSRAIHAFLTSRDPLYLPNAQADG